MILLALIFLFGGDAWLSVIDFTMIAAIATLGLNVLSGYAGQISLGIAFFMGVGAYTAGVARWWPAHFPRRSHRAGPLVSDLAARSRHRRRR